MIIIGMLALFIVLAVMTGPVIVPLVIVGFGDADDLIELFKWAGILACVIAGAGIIGIAYILDFVPTAPTAPLIGGVAIITLPAVAVVWIIHHAISENKAFLANDKKRVTS